jgi:hypothetical protein
MISNILIFKDCLQIMDSGSVFSLECVTYDAKRPENTGDTRRYDEAILLAHVGKVVQRKNVVPQPKGEPVTRKADNQVHFIRDIQPLTGGIPVGHPVRVHPRLILFFNSKTVMP